MSIKADNDGKDIMTGTFPYCGFAFDMERKALFLHRNDHELLTLQNCSLVFTKDDEFTIQAAGNRGESIVLKGQRKLTGSEEYCLCQYRVQEVNAMSQYKLKVGDSAFGMMMVSKSSAARL